MLYRIAGSYWHDSVGYDLNKAETVRDKELAKSGRVKTKTLAINYAKIDPTIPFYNNRY